MTPARSSSVQSVNCVYFCEYIIGIERKFLALNLTYVYVGSREINCEFRTPNGSDQQWLKKNVLSYHDFHIKVTLSVKL